jgi:hypothetical protein
MNNWWRYIEFEYELSCEFRLRSQGEWEKRNPFYPCLFMISVSRAEDTKTEVNSTLNDSPIILSLHHRTHTAGEVQRTRWELRTGLMWGPGWGEDLPGQIPHDWLPGLCQIGLHRGQYALLLYGLLIPSHIWWTWTAETCKQQNGQREASFWNRTIRQ